MGHPAKLVPGIVVGPRRAVKRDEIVEAIRREIIRGKYQAGDQLPKQLELVKRFKISALTIQRAMDRLVHEGFLETRHAKGTFVVERPPHLHHYALVFPADPTDLAAGGWSHFYATLVNEAAKIQQMERRRIECFYRILEPVDQPHYHHLVAKVKAHRFAGVIFAAHPGRLIGSTLVEWPGVPRVGVMTYDPAWQKIPAVQTNPIAWFEKACDYIVSRGRRRVALINKPSAIPAFEWNRWQAILADRGLRMRPHWNLPVPLWAVGASHCVQLLMQNPKDRPDALLLMDDNLVEPTVAGLMAAGVRVPTDVEVVAHANFPLSGPRLLSMKYLGFDNHQILRACIALIDEQRRGRKVPMATTIQPVFEEEFVNKKLAAELIPAR